MRQFNRRRFMLIAAGTAGAAAAGGVFLGGNPSWPVITRQTRALGTEVSITARHCAPDVADRAIVAGFAE